METRWWERCESVNLTYRSQVGVSSGPFLMARSWGGGLARGLGRRSGTHNLWRGKVKHRGGGVGLQFFGRADHQRAGLDNTLPDVVLVHEVLAADPRAPADWTSLSPQRSEPTTKDRLPLKRQRVEADALSFVFGSIKLIAASGGDAEVAPSASRAIAVHWARAVTNF